MATIAASFRGQASAPANHKFESLRPSAPLRLRTCPRAKQKARCCSCHIVKNNSTAAIARVDISIASNKETEILYCVCELSRWNAMRRILPLQRNMTLDARVTALQTNSSLMSEKGIEGVVSQLQQKVPTKLSRHVNLRLREHLERWSYCQICRLGNCRRVTPPSERGRRSLLQQIETN